MECGLWSSEKSRAPPRVWSRFVCRALAAWRPRAVERLDRAVGRLRISLPICARNLRAMAISAPAPAPALRDSLDYATRSAPRRVARVGRLRARPVAIRPLLNLDFFTPARAFAVHCACAVSPLRSCVSLRSLAVNYKYKVLLRCRSCLLFNSVY